MKIDYFSEGGIKTDRSDLFASITCLNPILNGGIAPYFCSFDPWEDRFKCPVTDNGRLVDSWFVKGCKAFSIASNLLVPGHSQNYEPEHIKYKIKTTLKNEIVYQIRVQSSIFFDFNIENLGHNRREGESLA